MRRIVPTLVLALAATGAPFHAPPLAAQKAPKLVPRPKLRDVTDTNDAQAYFQAGVQNFRADPGYAADAFYWASRLNPGWADPLYGRRAAALAQKRDLLNAAMDGRLRRKPELLALDTLQARAYMLNPFLYRRLDALLFINYITDGDRTVQAQYAYEINVWLQQASPAFQAWYAYAQGNFDRALKEYGRAIAQARDKTAGLHLERARILGMRNEVEPAVAEFQLALGELRSTDEKKLVVFYDSKALAEFSVATLLEGAGQQEKAKEAYGRALQEDLAYYPAHMRLGLLALTQGDTAAAISELAMASEIAPTDAFVQYMNGWVLGKTKHTKEAVVALTRATQLEPYYALPNLLLGAQYEALDKAPEALAAYERFLTTASATDPQRKFAMDRIEDVKAFLNAPKTQ
jgi:tetratricopeptide (TPR) repeat protein